MASSVVVPHRSQLLNNPVAGVVVLLVITIVLSCFTTVADSARAAKPPPIKVSPGCSTTLMPKRCSVRVSSLAKTLAETKATIAGPTLAAAKLKSDSCITECARVVDEAASKAAAAEKDGEGLNALKEYLRSTIRYSDGPIGPCECNCPEPCTADEAAAVKKLGDATGSMRDFDDYLEDLIDKGRNKDANRAEAAEMEKSMDSGILHVSCGLTREPQRCADELSALAKTTEDDKHAVWDLQEFSEVKPAPALNSVIESCRFAVKNVSEDVYFAEAGLRNLAAIRATLRSYVEGDGNNPPLCKYSCPPPPPEKPCTANETAIADKMTHIRDAWVAADKFLTELLPPAEEQVKGKEAPTKKKQA